MSMNFKLKEGRKLGSTYNELPSMTSQEFKDDCDINKISARHRENNMPLPVSQLQSFSDVSEIPSFAEAMEIVTDAKRAFMSLPAKFRDRMNNDPQKMLDFVNDPQNHEEARVLGLLKPPSVEVPKAPIEEPKPQ
ncbi:scaffold protein [Microviridae sp.]|nr:scaffold protein [Microviridae sp.]